MTEWLREWLVGVVAALLLTVLAEDIVSQRAMRVVLRLAGGILLILALIRPMNTSLPGELSASMSGFQRELERTTAYYREEHRRGSSAVIAEELAAYIVDKAEEMGAQIKVSVAVGFEEGDVPVPKEVCLVGEKLPELEKWLTEELDIPAEAQYWQEE